MKQKSVRERQVGRQAGRQGEGREETYMVFSRKDSTEVLRSDVAFLSPLKRTLLLSPIRTCTATTTLSRYLGSMLVIMISLGLW